MENMLLDCLLVLKYGMFLGLGGTTLSLLIGESSKHKKVEKFNKIQLGMTYDEVKDLIGFEGNLLEETKVTSGVRMTFIWYMGWYTKSKDIGKSNYSLHQNGKYYSTSGEKNIRTDYKDRAYIKVVLTNYKVTSKEQKGLGL